LRKLETLKSLQPDLQREKAYFEHDPDLSGRTVHIEQGVEIQRPSHLFVRAERAGGKIRNVVVGGNAVEIAAGEYRL
jgi:predicted PhzF superfamily epimerase YddE/YHI9